MECDGAGFVGVVGTAPFADVRFQHSAYDRGEFPVFWCGVGVCDGWPVVGDLDGAHGFLSLSGLLVRKGVGRRC